MTKEELDKIDAIASLKGNRKTGCTSLFLAKLARKEIEKGFSFHYSEDSEGSERVLVDLNNLTDVEFGGIDHSDSPKYCDAYIQSARHSDGTPLTDNELDYVNEQSDFVHETLYNQLY